MLTVKIHRVEEKLGVGEKFGQGIFPHRFRCGVECNGKKEWAEVTVGSKSETACPMADKYLVQGGEFCSKSRKEYNGEGKYYMDGTATKALHGDEYKGGSGGSYSPQNHSQGGGGHTRQGYTLKEIIGLYSVCYEGVSEVVGKVEDKALVSAVATVFIAAKNEGIKVTNEEPAAARQEDVQDFAHDEPPEDGAWDDGDDMKELPF